MKLKELTNKFSYLTGTRPEGHWYDLIFPSDSDANFKTYFDTVYGDLASRFKKDNDDYYTMNYLAFINSIDEPMKHYLALIKTEYSPYDNVFEKRTETTTIGGVTVTTTKGQRQDTMGGATDSYQKGATSNTSTSYTMPQNGTTERETSKNVDSGATYTDTNTIGTRTNTIGSSTDTNSTPEHINTFKVDRSGNIGTTMTQQMGEAEISYASKLKLYDFYAKEYCNVFSLGYWEV